MQADQDRRPFLGSPNRARPRASTARGPVGPRPAPRAWRPHRRLRGRCGYRRPSRRHRRSGHRLPASPRAAGQEVRRQRGGRAGELAVLELGGSGAQEFQKPFGSRQPLLLPPWSRAKIAPPGARVKRRGEVIAPRQRADRSRAVGDPVVARRNRVARWNGKWPGAWIAPGPRGWLRGPATQNATRSRRSTASTCVDSTPGRPARLPTPMSRPRQRRADVLLHVSLLVLVHVSRCRSSGWRPTNPVRSRSGATGAGGPR